jgi:glycosyltransferase involved in cell wall biosynthesis
MSSWKHKISVILPVFNGERFVDDAFETIAAQSLKPDEIIVINDGSTDETEKKLEKYSDKIIYRKIENSGPGEARNIGIQLASGNIIAFLDVDDVWPEKKLETQLSRFEENAGLMIVMGLIQHMLLNQEKNCFEKFRNPNLAVNLGASLFKKEVFSIVGMFNPAIRIGEDLDWFMRARNMNTATYIDDEVGLFYRLHETNTSKVASSRHSTLFRLLKKNIIFNKDK